MCDPEQMRFRHNLQIKGWRQPARQSGWRNARRATLGGMVDDAALDRIIDAYGGLTLWRKLESVVLQLDSFGGPLPIAKGLERTFARPSIVTVSPLHSRTEFHEFPQPGERAIYSRGRVQLIDRSGALTLDHPNHRESFRGLKKYRRWSHADAAYFFGYSLVTYLSIPFLLLEHATSAQPCKGGVRVRARFPQSFDTHSADQVFWFGRDGLLVRHDYRAEVVGWWAAGAHFTSAYHTVSGFPVATQRRVYARVFRAVTSVAVLWASMHPIEVKIAQEPIIR